MMKNFIVRWRTWCFLALLASQLIHGQALANGQFLRVEGQKIVDGNGKAVMLRGVNMNKNHWQVEGSPLGYGSQEDIQYIKSLGHNVVRLVLRWRDFTPVGDQTAVGYQLIDEYLAWCEAEGIYIILDMHIFPSDEELGKDKIWTDSGAKQQFLSLWKAIAQYYANNPTIVGYDLYNEPATTDPQQWWDLATTTIETIRTVDTNHIFFVETAGGEQPFQRLNDANVVYSYHDYTPFIVSHAGTNWVGDSSIPDDYAYPGRVLEGIKLSGIYPEDGIVFTDSTTDWVCLEKTLTPPANVDFASLKLMAVGTVGNVWFDNIQVFKNGDSQTVYNSNAETESVKEGEPAVWNFWTNEDYDLTGTWSSEYSYGGGQRSLQITGNNTGEYGSWLQAPSSSDSVYVDPQFQIKPDDEFQIKGCIYAPENNGGKIYIGFDYFNGQYTDYDREQLVADIEPYVEWAKAENVPLYVGEFGGISNALGDSRYNLVADKISVMNEANIHWTFWLYRHFGSSDGGHFGLYVDQQLDERMAEILQVKTCPTPAVYSLVNKNLYLPTLAFEVLNPTNEQLTGQYAVFTNTEGTGFDFRLQGINDFRIPYNVTLEATGQLLSVDDTGCNPRFTESTQILDIPYLEVPQVIMGFNGKPVELSDVLGCYKAKLKRSLLSPQYVELIETEEIICQ